MYQWHPHAAGACNSRGRQLRSACPTLALQSHRQLHFNSSRCPGSLTRTLSRLAGFEKASRSWLDLFRVHLEPVIRHVRVVGPPVTMGQPSVLMSWNANGSLPLSTFRKVLHSIVSADGVREFHAWQPRRANESSMSPQNQHGGHCGTTRAGDEGDCERGERGSLAVGPVLPDLAACRDACARCSRCNYVSFSAANKECSWFHSCRLNRLQLEPKMWTQQTDGKFAQVPSDWVSLGVSARHAGSKRIDRHSIPKEE